MEYTGKEKEKKATTTTRAKNPRGLLSQSPEGQGPQKQKPHNCTVSHTGTNFLFLLFCLISISILDFPFFFFSLLSRKFSFIINYSNEWQFRRSYRKMARGSFRIIHLSFSLCSKNFYYFCCSLSFSLSRLYRLQKLLSEIRRERGKKKREKSGTLKK